jgi:hypothetical protein
VEKNRLQTEDEILDNLILLGHLHGHRAARMLNQSAEFVNETNKITVKIVSHKEVQIAYNFHNQITPEIISSELIYEFFEDLLKRKETQKINLQYGTLIHVHHWKEQLQPALLKIEEEKSYDQYLKHLKIKSERFDVEYFDGIVVLRDKEKQLRNNVLRLRKALQQCI